VTAGDRDSGRGSPTGSINSAIVRRRRHRASKNTFVWMTHGQTIHPKSQKNNIERLMKLILEQGEVIQQQLAKLRLVEMSSKGKTSLEWVSIYIPSISKLCQTAKRNNFTLKEKMFVCKEAA
jgi:hypothetical protein